MMSLTRKTLECLSKPVLGGRVLRFRAFAKTLQTRTRMSLAFEIGSNVSTWSSQNRYCDRRFEPIDDDRSLFRQRFAEEPNPVPVHHTFNVSGGITPACQQIGKPLQIRDGIQIGWSLFSTVSAVQIAADSHVSG
jgi:hypothetical protein